MRISDDVIERIMNEDVPYMDLTTQLLGIGQAKGRLEFISREDGVASCTEEVARIFDRLGISVSSVMASGAPVKAGDIIIAGEGSAESLHMAWKVSLNILEYSMGIATSAHNLIEKARIGNPDAAVFFTRKSFPGIKEIAVKSAFSGGMLPHRLGVSETFLAFSNHAQFCGGLEGVASQIPSLKKRVCEKKILVEVESEDDAVMIAKSGADGIQVDKFTPEDLSVLVGKVRDINDRITLVAAGGINHSNISEYAATGVDAIATSCIFHAKPLDIKAIMTSMQE